MLTLSYTALVTPAEVRRAALGSFSDTILAGLQPTSGEDSDAAASDIYDACVEIIEDVTARIEQRLHRELIVRPHRQVFAVANVMSLRRLDDGYGMGDWTHQAGYESAGGTPFWLAWARQWPVLQVLSVDGRADLAPYVVPQDDGRRLMFDAADLDNFPTEIRYFAGYRRADQGIGETGSGEVGSGEVGSGSIIYAGDLTAQPGLEDLVVSPPELPRDVRRVALRLVIHEMRQQLQGLVGVERTSKQIDRMTVESTRFQGDFEEEELAKLDSLAYEGA